MYLRLSDLPKQPAVLAEVVRRFWLNVTRAKPDRCWIWIGDSKTGYGQLVVHLFSRRIRVVVAAHRFSYLISTGEDPGEFMVCHRCDVKLCVNPAHLFKGTAKENTQDHLAKKGRRS